MGNAYGETVNASLLEFIGELHGRVLDVGCGRGAWGLQLRQLGATELIGIEPSRDAAFAEHSYDQVISGSVEHLELPDAEVVILADVLEHLVEPWTLLRRLRHATPQACVFISVPNMQSYRALLEIARGDFPYDDSGGFWDSTHLRWFTKRSMIRLLESTGWRIERTQYLLGGGLRSRLDTLALGRLSPWLASQFCIAAVPASMPTLNAGAQRDYH